MIPLERKVECSNRFLELENGLVTFGSKRPCMECGDAVFFYEKSDPLYTQFLHVCAHVF